MKVRTILFLLFTIVLNSCISNLTDKELVETYQKSITDNDWEKALKCVQEGLKRNSSDTNLYFSRALCLKKLNPIDNHKKILEDVNIFLSKYQIESRGRLLKYTSLYENQYYQEAIQEVKEIERFYGISVNTILMKAYAQFLDGDYKSALFNFEEALMYPHAKEEFKNIYYYKVYSKYFDGNIEGAMWDASFIEKYGFERDTVLLDLMYTQELSIENYNKIPFYSDALEFDQEIRVKLNLKYDRLFRPFHSSYLYNQPYLKLSDLKSLNQNIEYINLSNAEITELPKEIKNFKKLKALNLSRNKIRDFDQLFPRFK